MVLAPYTAAAWQLLADALRAVGAADRAAWAEQAVLLLSQPEAPVASSAADKAADVSLALADGRPLPLRTTPAARHHDTVAARLAQVAISSGSTWVNTVQWATRAREGQVGTATQGTQTSIVRRARGAPSGQAGPRQPAAGDANPPPITQTSRIWAPTAAAAAPATAAGRRLGGWPMTDEITLTAFGPHPDKRR